MYTLGKLIEKIDEILNVIEQINRAMRHTSSASVEVLRRHKEQLEEITEYIMEQEISSSLDLEGMLMKHKKCLRECMESSYSNKRPYTERSRDYTP
ncbi:hypothetical protein [Brevibacillus laterosporus]|uniref:hypothetical protein n=1 Tax=Brevibacillus laterosporus TaxID=1465 RepID=UPI00264C62A6|nr:hypothetical protein [Brevibacillus laterosporus]MDN9009074.1 hypothetical protein [Brevibacillus laterosporus]MDO0942527.1 hypothetical protein [Brevibacillus laterosporus]